MDMHEAINPISMNPISIDAVMDVGWVNRFNRTLGEETLHWAEGIELPEADEDGFTNFYSLRGRENGSLLASPLSWNVWLSELQITSTLVKFMAHPASSVRYNRVVSFLKALNCRSDCRAKCCSDCLTVLPSEREYIDVLSERWTDDGDGRIDILIAWGEGNKDAPYRQAVIVEVKQGASLGPCQLKKYETAAPLISDSFQFAFIYRFLSTTDAEQLAESNRRLERSQRWACSQWWAFLRRMETNIEASADDFEFRQFRSTLWEQLS